jgi:hypothetical protein
MHYQVTRVVWWGESDFGLPAPICNRCGLLVDLFPAPVLGLMVACQKTLCFACRAELHVHPGDNVFVESIDFLLGVGEGKPEVDFGGRRLRGRRLRPLMRLEGSGIGAE